MSNPAEIYEEEESIVQLALDNFGVLLNGADFAAELSMLGIGRLQFLRRRQMLVELRGLYIALWRLALGRSFPRDADTMLAVFIHNYLMRNREKGARETTERARHYWEMLAPVGDSNFTEVSRHLVSLAIKEDKDTTAVVLKLALAIRSTYQTIFDKLF